MSLSTLRIARASGVLLVVAGLAACAGFDRASRNVAGIVTPYKVDVVQGNFVSKEQVALLQPGLSRQQVREVLGTPLLASVFHADRWDYVFTIHRQGVEPQARKLSVFFKGDGLDRFEGDNMPSEAEFVATLEGRRNLGKPKVLEASESSLGKFPAPKEPAMPPDTGGSGDALAPTSYPPLEAAPR